jgi:hypothetical protein
VQVGTFNGTGKAYLRHYDIWTINALQEEMALAEELRSNITSNQIVNWTNGNLYQKSPESFGIVALSPTLRQESGMRQFMKDLDHKQPQAFLAMRQGTALPVLPVHTKEEYSLFRKLLADASHMEQGSGKVKWGTVLVAWNRSAEHLDNVFYKVGLLSNISNLSPIF